LSDDDLEDVPVCRRRQRFLPGETLTDEHSLVTVATIKFIVHEGSKLRREEEESEEGHDLATYIVLMHVALACG
jgi:hypothetical protein